MGIRHCEFRLVGWNRSRGNIYLGHPAFAFPTVAHCDQPLHGSDDAIRRLLRRFDAVASFGSSVGVLLAGTISRHDATLAAVPESTGVGRFCSRNLFHALAVVLVSWAGT